MAQHNITLNQEEILELLQDSRPDAFKNLLQESLNGVFQTESRSSSNTSPVFSHRSKFLGYKGRPSSLPIAIAH